MSAPEGGPGNRAGGDQSLAGMVFWVNQTGAFYLKGCLSESEPLGDTPSTTAAQQSAAPDNIFEPCLTNVHNYYTIPDPGS